jgi:MFS transporter, DHA2 family, multidrug resistance protein
MNLWLDQDYAAPQLLWPNVIRALGQAIVMTPHLRDRDDQDNGG